MPKPKFTVRKEDLQKGARMETQAHPWVSPTRARRLARDNLQTQGPGYYRADKVNDSIVQNINKKLRARPIRRKPRPPQNPLTRFAGNPFR